MAFSNHSWDHQPKSLTLMEIPLLEFPAAQTQVLSLGRVMSLGSSRGTGASSANSITGLLVDMHGPVNDGA